MRQILKKAEESAKRRECALEVYAKLSDGGKVAVMRIASNLPIEEIRARVAERIGREVEKLYVRCASEVVEMNELNLSLLVEDYKANRIQHLTLFTQND